MIKRILYGLAAGVSYGVTYFLGRVFNDVIGGNFFYGLVIFLVLYGCFILVINNFYRNHD